VSLAVSPVLSGVELPVWLAVKSSVIVRAVSVLGSPEVGRVSVAAVVVAGG